MQYEFESSYIIVTFRKTLNMVIVYVKQNLWKISRTTLCLTVIENIKATSTVVSPVPINTSTGF